jgi:AcrR family transcriptional regulator
MGDIAKEAGVSRQALYLHFASRTDLLIATTHYGDEVRRLNERIRGWQTAFTGVAVLREYINFWGNYMPEIYGIAKALMMARDTDEAANAAWNERMSAVKGGCRYTIEALARDGMLAPEWTIEEATEIFWTLLSFRNWEQFTIECGWSNSQYIARMQTMARGVLVKGEVDEAKIAQTG